MRCQSAVNARVIGGLGRHQAQPETRPEIAGTCPGKGGVMAWTSFGAYGEKIKIVLDGNDDIGDDDDMDCKKCGHSWKPIVEKPLKCPACNQPKYWLEKVRNRDEEAVRGMPRSTGGTARPGANGASDKANLPGVPVGQAYRRSEKDFRSGAGEGGDAEAVATCRSCEGTLRNMNGKLVCCVIGCSMQGLEQGRPKR